MKTWHSHSACPDHLQQSNVYTSAFCIEGTLVLIGSRGVIVSYANKDQVAGLVIMTGLRIKKRFKQF